MFAFDVGKLNGRGHWFVRNLSKAITRNVRSVRCVGHTDSKGAASYNYQLGLERARNVCHFLHQLRPYLHMKVVSAGEHRPRATNKTAHGRALNRRVEIILNYK